MEFKITRNISDFKIRKSFSLTPVRIYLDEINEILSLLREHFKEEDLKIESDKYIYDSFDELAESIEDNTKTLKITNKDKTFSINFKSDIEIKFNDKKLFGLAFKIYYLLRKNKIKFQTFLHHFYNYYALILIGIYFGYIYYFRGLMQSNTEMAAWSFVLFISFILLGLFFSIFSFIKKEKLAYSKIILHWKNEDYRKIKFKKDYSRIAEWIKLLIPPVVTFILGYLLKFFFE